MPNDIDSQLRSLIESFARELQAALRSSIAADLLSALDGGPSVRRGPGRPRGSGKAAPAAAGAPRRGPGRPRKAISADASALGVRVLSVVKQTPGQSVSEIAAALGTKSDALKQPIAQLLASKQLSKKGQRRGTRYYFGKAGGGAASASGGKRMARKMPRKAKAKKAGPKPKRSPAEQAAIDARMAKMRAARQAKTGKG